MAFNTREEFTKAQASEKLTLAHVEGRTRLYEWVSEGGGVWSKVVPYFVSGLKEGTSTMVRHTNASPSAGEFYYNTVTSTLYAHFTGSVDPTTIEVIVTYRFFFADGPCALSWDLSNAGEHVRYQGRIITSPGYKHVIGVDQGLTSVVGSGTLKLQNTDGELDAMFDTLYFENREAVIYSWNRDLAFADAKVIYRGRITNKRFGPTDISFLIKDTLFDLEQALPLSVYDDNDNVNDSVKGRYKRRVYGRVDGLQLQSIDQIGDGYTITGTVTANVESNVLTGSGTSFLSETSPGDEITIGTQTFNIDSVNSDTEIILDDEAQYAFTGQSAVLVPEIPTVVKNRTFFVTGHACSNLTYTVSSVLQLNRVVLNDTTGLLVGDFVEFQNGERKEIKSVAPGNIIVLRNNIITEPAIGSTVIRQPIQRLYRGRDLVDVENYTISNLGAPTNECTVTLDSDTEFQLARAKQFAINMTFTNGTRTITTVDDVDLRDSFSPRDWIRPADLTYTTYYEILDVDQQTITIRTNFTDPTITDTVTAKLPDYIGDDTILSAELIGKTVNGEPSGTWIKTAAQAVNDILTDINISTDYINAASFTQANTDAQATISIALPLSPTGGAVPAKTAVDLINKSVLAALTLDNDLKLKYKVLQTDTPDNPARIYDEDIIKWNIKTTSGKGFRDSVVRYRHKDVDRLTLSSGNLVQTYTSDFINKYIETSKLEEFDAYLFNTNEAAIYAERQVYYNRISRSSITIETDLRFENVEIGDVMQLEMVRLYKRLGGDDSRKKIALVVGKIVTGESVQLELTDLGNLFNTSAIIAPNTTNEFASATEEEVLKYGFITDNQGIVNNDETTANTNLIS